MSDRIIPAGVMNYDMALTALIEALKADKSIIQPWRNKAVARAEEVQAFVRMGKTSTSGYAGSFVAQSVDVETVVPYQTCICPPNMPRLDCPVHGGQ